VVLISKGKTWVYITLRRIYDPDPMPNLCVSPYVQELYAHSHDVIFCFQ
jgi:hypothetical protein